MYLTSEGKMRSTLIFVVLVFLACANIQKATAHRKPAWSVLEIRKGQAAVHQESTSSAGRTDRANTAVDSGNTTDHVEDAEANRRRLSYDMRTIREWLLAHNEERSMSFNGSALKWDKKIARFAQKHADSIMHSTNCAAEFNEDNEEYGENIFWAVYEHGQKPWTPGEAVEHWVKQKVNYNVEDNKCAPEGECAAYLQVVWKITARIGCGEVFCPYSGDFKGVAQFFVCNYYPAARLGPDHPRPY